MPYRPLLYTSCTLDSFQSLKSSLIPKVHGDYLRRNAVLVWIFPSDLLPSFACVPSVSRPTVCLFPQCRSCHIHKEKYRYNSQSSVGHLLASSHEWGSHGVPQLENSVDVVSVRYTFELLRDTSYIRYRYKTEWLHPFLPKNISLGFVDSKNPMR